MMNWKLLSMTLLGLTVVACDGKKEEKKTEETPKAHETPKAEGTPRAEEVTPLNAEKAEEPKADEAPKAGEATLGASHEMPKEEKKGS